MTIFTSITTLSSIIVIPRIIDVCLQIFELYEKRFLNFQDNTTDLLNNSKFYRI